MKIFNLFLGYFMVRFFVFFALCTGLFTLPSFANVNEALEQKKGAEQEHKTLRTKIQQLRQEINQNIFQKNTTQKNIEETKKVFSSNLQVLNNLVNRKEALEGKKLSLEQKQAALSKSVDEQTDSLKMVLHAHHQLFFSHSPSLLKQFLAARDSSEVFRQKNYFSYIEKAQLVKILEYKALQNDLKKNIVETEEISKEIQKNYAEINLKVASLEQKISQQKKQLSSISSSINKKKKTLSNWREDEKNLAQLIFTLNKSIQRQAAKERARKLAEERARAAAAAKKENGKKTTPRPPNIETAEKSPPPPLSFAARSPIYNGKLGLRFGQKSLVGAQSRGWFFDAVAGTPVLAIADGRVIFANSLKGLGLLMVIDHGSGFLSLYANNKSLVKRVDDLIKKGDTIALVGSGNSSLFSKSESGLYFELRVKGKPVDPAVWIR